MNKIRETETEQENTITEVTRRAIIDYLSIGRQWSGAMPEDDFLGRLYDLKRMPSTDSRREFDTAAIAQIVNEPSEGFSSGTLKVSCR